MKPVKKQKIVVDGVEYLLNVDGAAKAGLLETTRTFKNGAVFRILRKYGGESLALLALVEYRKYALIDVEDGNCWTNPVDLPNDMVDTRISLDFIQRLASSDGSITAVPVEGKLFVK